MPFLTSPDDIWKRVFVTSPICLKIRRPHFCPSERHRAPHLFVPAGQSCQQTGPLPVKPFMHLLWHKACFCSSSALHWSLEPAVRPYRSLWQEMPMSFIFAGQFGLQMQQAVLWWFSAHLGYQSRVCFSHSPFPLARHFCSLRLPGPRL